jgi:hypothetical protein
MYYIKKMSDPFSVFMNCGLSHSIFILITSIIYLYYEKQMMLPIISRQIILYITQFINISLCALLCYGYGEYLIKNIRRNHEYRRSITCIILCYIILSMVHTWEMIYALERLHIKYIIYQQYTT